MLARVWVLKTKSSEHHAISSPAMECFAQSSIYAAVTSTMMLLANIQPVLDARAPNQFTGLAFADHTIPRATLDVSDLRIGCAGAQHPVESHG